MSLIMFMNAVTNSTFIVSATCTKNSRKSDPEDPAEGHASACRSQGQCYLEYTFKNLKKKQLSLSNGLVCLCANSSYASFDFEHAVTNTTFIVSATCKKNSQNSDNQVKPNKHALENPEEGNASASPNQGQCYLECTFKNLKGKQLSLSNRLLCLCSNSSYASFEFEL